MLRLLAVAAAVAAEREQAPLRDDADLRIAIVVSMNLARTPAGGQPDLAVPLPMERTRP